MNLRLFTSARFRATLAVALTALPSLASAQVANDGAASGLPVADSAALMIRDAMAEKKAERAAAKAAESVRRQAAFAAGVPTTGAGSAAGAPPTAPTTSTPKSGGLQAGDFKDITDIKPGFENPRSPGIAYSAELTSTLPYGNVGRSQVNLKGGFDGQIYIAPEKYTRIFAGYYDVDFYPIGFDSGTVPAYVSNAALRAPNPLGRTNCIDAGLGAFETCPARLGVFSQDAGVQDRISILSFQKIIYVGGLFPIVISPTYLSQRGSIGGGDDQFLAWDPSRGTYHDVHVRTSQKKSIFLSLPFAASTKLFGVLTAGPSWNVNTNGNNTGNSAQIFEVLDLRYFATPTTTIFFQPSRLPTYEPVDPYPVNIPTFILGFNKKLGGPKSPFYVQGELFTATPSNPPYGHTGRLGVIDTTCVAPQTATTSFQTECALYKNINPRTNTATLFGGTKSTTINLTVGFGTPSVIPI